MTTRVKRNRRKRTGQSPVSAALSTYDSEIPAMVRQAVRHGDVLLAFQPVVDAGHPGGPPAFHEGLIRVLDDRGVVIPARDFIHTVEQTETGRDLDCLALSIGLRTLAQVPDLRLSVNMSARSIGYPRWMRTLEAGLIGDETVAERLIVEITESSALAVPDHVRAFMTDMRQRGIALALDDFGAGFTALRYFREFRFDMLKIDGQFIRGIARDRTNQVLTTAMVHIANHFDMLVVAESVENQEDADYLDEIGVTLRQGYFYGAPTVAPPWDTAGRRRRPA